MKIFFFSLELIIGEVLIQFFRGIFENGDSMTRVDIYNEEYVGLNHAYVQMYKFYNRLIEERDADEDVLAVIREILLVFNPTLDKIKSEMTVKTRYKEEPEQKTNSNPVQAKAAGDSVILHGNFTGD